MKLSDLWIQIYTTHSDQEGGFIYRVDFSGNSKNGNIYYGFNYSSQDGDDYLDGGMQIYKRHFDALKGAWRFIEWLTDLETLLNDPTLPEIKDGKRVGQVKLEFMELMKDKITEYIDTNVLEFNEGKYSEV